MAFIEPTLDNFLSKLNKLSEDASPQWGSMSAQRMVEHLSDAVDLSMGKITGIELEIPEEKIPKAQAYILSEHPMPKNFNASFAKPDTPLRNDNLTSAIQEFEIKWKAFEATYEKEPEMKQLHANFGELDHKLWLALHSKHFSHHFEQFNLI